MTDAVEQTQAPAAAAARYQRSPVDLLHLVTAALALVVATLLSRFFPSTIGGFEEDLIELVDQLPVWLRVAVAVVLQLAITIAAITVFIWAWRRSRRTALTAFGAALAASLLFRLVDQWLARQDAPGVDEPGIPGSLTQGEAWPSSPGLAWYTAGLVVLNSILPRRWRVALWWLWSTLLLLRVISATTLALDLVVAVALGATVGFAALLVVGRLDTRPTEGDVEDALRSLGVTDPVVAPAQVDARGSTPYFATAAAGRRVFAKVLTDNERYADRMFRLYRRLRFRSLGDEVPFSTLRRAVEHEALLSLAAADAGVRTPPLIGLAVVGDADDLLIAYDAIAGKSLDGVAPERITDDVLRQVWQLVAGLHARQIAHRDLRLANVFLDDEDRAWIIDFGFGEAACSADQKAADIAELLTSSATVVGASRAVAVAASVLPADELIAATGRLQPLALSTATRTAAKKMDGGLEGLRAEVARQTGREAVELPDLQRVSPGTLLTLLVIGAAVYFLLPQLADIPGLIGQVKEANLAWVGPVILASLATYAGAALGLASSVAPRVSYVPALAVSLAGSFVNRLAPVKVAGAALNIRFLQRRGIDPLAAVAGAGLIAFAGMIGHLSITTVAIVGAGRDGGGLPFELPDVKWIFGGVALILILVGVGIWVPQAAKIVREQVLPAIRKTRDGLQELARQPHKIIGLIIGGLLVPLSYSLCLYFSTQAFGADVSLAAVAVVFLTIGTVASAAPTPGGVGAVEAALIAGLTGIGMASEMAVASVFLYRLATFWVPVLPGWGAFTWLRHADEV